MAPSQPTPSRHPMSLTASKLSGLANETRKKIKWDRILVLRESGSKGAHWKWQENQRNFSIYTKKELLRGGSVNYGVLAVGVVKASVNEVSSLLVAHSQDEYVQKMEALYDKDFKDGQYLYDVKADNTPSDQGSPPPHLSVRTTTFNKLGGWLTANDEWCHLDATYHDKNTQAFEKIMTTLKPEEVMLRDKKASSGIRSFHDVIGGYRVEPARRDSGIHEDEDEKDAALARKKGGRKPKFASRVHFYGDFTSSPTSLRLGKFALPTSKTEADKAIKQRLLHLAKDCHRLSLLIRRRRLGLQVLVDKKRFLPPTNVPCHNCQKPLMIAKLCRLCGNGVCSDCSDRYERETKSQGSRRSLLDSIRVCDPCINHVESADYSAISDTSLNGPMVVPDAASKSAIETSPKSLNDLLREALVQAPNDERKASVMSVIRCVLDQEVRGATKSIGSLTTTSSESEYVEALGKMPVENIPYSEATFRSNEERCYRLDTRNVDGSAVDAPIADNEELRLQIVDRLDMDELSKSVELRILTQLAATELGCYGSTISILDRDNLNVVATNVESLHRAKFPRAKTLCAHTIMETKANLVAHPEADIRFADTIPVKLLGIKFYFAFPVIGEGGHIVGSFCVMNNKTMEINESQYTAFKKLAETANKVIRVHTEQRQRRNSATSSTGSSRRGNGSSRVLN